MLFIASRVMLFFATNKDIPGNFVSWLSLIALEQKNHGLESVWSPYPAAYTWLNFFLFKAVDFSVVNFWLMFKAINIVSSFVILLLVYNLARMYGNGSQGTWAAITYTLLPSDLFWSVIDMHVYDPFASALLLLSIYLMVRENVISSAFVGAVATSIKVYPGIILLAALKLWRGRRRFGFVALFLFLLLAINLPLFLSGPKMFMSTFFWHSGRPPWSTLYALVEYLRSEPYVPTIPAYIEEEIGGESPLGYYFVGITPGWRPPNPSIFHIPVEPQPIQWYNAVSMLLTATIILAISLRWRGFGSIQRDLSAYALAMLTAYFLWNYGWSPQWILYLSPLLLIALPSLKGLSVLLILETVEGIAYPGMTLLKSLTNYWIEIYWVMVLARTLLLAMVLDATFRRN